MGGDGTGGEGRRRSVGAASGVLTVLTELGDSRATAAAGRRDRQRSGGEGGEGEGRAALRDAEAVKRGEHQAARSCEMPHPHRRPSCEMPRQA